MEMLRLNFDALRNLHACANDLLDLPLTQQALIQRRHKKWVDEVSEGSLRMLDVCGITRDVLSLVKEHLQDLQSSLRRSIGERGLEMRISAHHFSKQKVSREMFKCLQALKGMDNNFDTSLLSDMDHDLKVIVTVLRELRTTTVSNMESILSFMSVSKPKLKSRRRLFILSCMRRNQVVSLSEENGISELEGVDSVLQTLYDQKLSRKSKLVEVQTANKRLEAFEVAIQGLEVEFECMFRRFIQTRVSLLNILNNQWMDFLSSTLLSSTLLEAYALGEQFSVEAE